MTFEYFDIHSHIYFPDYDKDREEEIKKMKHEKIGTISVGTSFDSSKECLKIAEAHENIFACIGQHPEELKDDSVFDDKLRDIAQNKNVVSIGETGLDYFRMDKDNEVMKVIQRTVFEYHIDLALEVEKPVMLHIRGSKDSQDAYLDALEILEHHFKISGDKLKGNAHFFAGDMEVLRRFLDIGFTVSFTGVITFARNYDELIKYTPLEMILAETDAPFVAPIPHRGKRNSPLYVPEVVKKLAEIKNEPFDKVKKTILENTKRSFNIS